MPTKTNWEKRIELEAMQFFGLRPNQVHTQYGPTIYMDGVREFALHCLREFAEEATGIALAHDTTEPHTHNSPCHEVIWSDILNLLPPKKEG